LTALNVQVMPPEQIRMGQGLMGVVRNIGSSLGVTVTSALFERRRVAHQLRAYDAYNETSAMHGATFDEVKRYLRQSGIVGGDANRAALRAIKQQIDIEAIVAAFRDSFMMISIAFLLASLPMVWLSVRRLAGSPSQALGHL
jgi:hypothetical protein